MMILTLTPGISLIVGTMIGSGIFVSPTGLLDRTGSVAMSLIVWTACGVVSMFGALAYAELGTMIPSSGAEYSYFMEAFGPFPAYMFSWVSTFIIKPSQLAIICMSFAAYAVEAFASECEPDPGIVQLTAVATVAVVTFVNCWSVNIVFSGYCHDLSDQVCQARHPGPEHLLQLQANSRGHHHRRGRVQAV